MANERVYTKKQQEALLAKWNKRVADGNFSEGVTGVGHMAVMSKAGDEAMTYPIIPSLDVLPHLSEEERFVISALNERCTAFVQQEGRALTNGSATIGYMATREFDPTVESHLVLIQTAGG